MNPLFRRFRSAVADALFPPRCVSCRSFIVTFEDGRLRTPSPDPVAPDPVAPDSVAPDPVAMDPLRSFQRAVSGWVCPVCADAFTPCGAPFCTVCGQPFPSPHQESHICSECLAKPPAFRKMRAVGIHAEPLTTLVHQLKYSARLQLAAPLGRLAHDAFHRHWTCGEIDAVLPVPLHTSRFRQRGFNQSYSLIREWSRLTDRCGEKRSWVIDRETLVRRRKTPAQTGLGRAERLVNIRGAFAVLAPERIRERRLLLVDDVYTTGATVNECVRVLLKAEARSVDILTLARAVKW